MNETEMSDEEKDDEFTELLKKGPRYGASEDYVHFNEFEDVLSSTDLMALVAPLIGKKPSYWKWMIVATHNALQGAMVCALADTTGTAVLDNKSGARMLAWLESREGDRGKPPKERLAEFSILLERCMTNRPNYSPLVLTDGQLKDIRRLHSDFRNNFSHFTPKGWSIQEEGLPRIVGTAVDTVEKLMSQDQVTWRLSGNQLRRLRANLKVARVPLQRIFPHRANG